MTKEDFFSILGLPKAFFLDHQRLRKNYLDLSRRSHPDHHLHSSASDITALEEMAGLANKAYQVLSDPDQRMVHILQLEGYPLEGSGVQLPADFLMDMMEVNESWEEAKALENNDLMSEILMKLQIMEASWKEGIHNELLKYDQHGTADFERIRQFMLQKRYIKRFHTNANT